jgi:hypothetical protein
MQVEQGIGWSILWAGDLAPGREGCRLQVIVRRFDSGAVDTVRDDPMGSTVRIAPGRSGRIGRR